MKALHYVGGALCVAASILISNAVLTFSAMPDCGPDVGAPACPGSVNLAAGEMVAGCLILVVGAIMTIGIGLLVALVSAGIYSLVRAILGPGGLFSSAGIVGAGFLALSVLIVIIGLPYGRILAARRVGMASSKRRAEGVITDVWNTGETYNDDVEVRLTIEYRRADNTTGHAVHNEVASPRNMPRRGDRVTVLYDPAGDEGMIELIGLAPAPNPMIVDAGPQDAVPPDELVAALDRLAALHRDGALTATEFDRAKRRLLGAG
ncbi:MAG TPA: SHOCT domain-containing protein [Pseudonocardiaceae bacterium]